MSAVELLIRDRAKTGAMPPFWRGLVQGLHYLRGLLQTLPVSKEPFCDTVCRGGWVLSACQCGCQSAHPDSVLAHYPGTHVLSIAACSPLNPVDYGPLPFVACRFSIGAECVICVAGHLGQWAPFDGPKNERIAKQMILDVFG